MDRKEEGNECVRRRVALGAGMGVRGQFIHLFWRGKV